MLALQEVAITYSVASGGAVPLHARNTEKNLKCWSKVKGDLLNLREKWQLYSGETGHLDWVMKININERQMDIRHHVLTDMLL